MSLATWWLEYKLRRIATRLKVLRSKQRHLRDQADRLHKASLPHEEAQRKAADLAATREKVTHEINRLVVDEEHVKAELRAAGVSLTTH